MESTPLILRLINFIDRHSPAHSPVPHDGKLMCFSHANLVESHQAITTLDLVDPTWSAVREYLGY